MSNRTSLVDQTVHELRWQILRGSLKAGERLPSERKLSVTLGVSRPTVREALKSLAVQGLVIRRGRRSVISQADPPPDRRASSAIFTAQLSIRELYEVRKLLEVRAAGWAALRATDSDRERIRQSLAARKFQERRAVNPNMNFHDAVIRSAHNPALEEVYATGSRLFFHFPFFWKFFEHAEVDAARAWRHELARRWHRHILRAIELHDPEEAEGAMFQHLDIMEKDLLARLLVTEEKAAPKDFYAHPMLAALRKAQRKK